LRGLTSKSDTIHTYKHSDKWSKIDVSVGIWLGNNQDSFQLHKHCSQGEKISQKVLGGLLFTDIVYAYEDDSKARELRVLG